MMRLQKLDNASTKRVSIFLLDKEQFKASKNFNQDEDSLREYTIQQLEWLRSEIGVQVFYTFLK